MSKFLLRCSAAYFAYQAVRLTWQAHEPGIPLFLAFFLLLVAGLDFAFAASDLHEASK